MAKKAAAKKPAQAVEQLKASRSAKAIAAALTKAFPKDAPRIVSIMRNAATSQTMKRKLGRVEVALASQQKGAK